MKVGEKVALNIHCLALLPPSLSLNLTYVQFRFTVHSKYVLALPGALYVMMHKLQICSSSDRFWDFHSAQCLCRNTRSKSGSKCKLGHQKSVLICFLSHLVNFTFPSLGQMQTMIVDSVTLFYPLSLSTTICINFRLVDARIILCVSIVYHPHWPQ